MIKVGLLVKKEKQFVITEFVITEFDITEFVITEFVVTEFDCIVKPVYNDHPWDPNKVTIVERWLLFRRGHLCGKV